MRKTILLAVILCAIQFAMADKSIAQNNPSDESFVDSIDYREDLLDSNLAYKQKFDSLSKNGEWVEVKKTEIINEVNQGSSENAYDESSSNVTVIYVWRPYAVDSYWNTSWNPYCNGRWEFTYYGWVWVSDYNWGWACYNYGRWYYSNFYGWVWLPGSYWAPNWVSWRNYGNYCGWYPICPRFRWRNHHGNWCRNYTYVSNPKQWVFCDIKDFNKKIDKTTVVHTESNNDMLKNSTKTKDINITRTNGVKIKYTGPEVSNVTKYTGVTNDPKEVKITKTTTQVTNEPFTVRTTKTNEPTKTGTTTRDPRGTTKEPTKTTEPGVKQEPPTKYNPPKSDPPTRRNDPPTRRNDPPTKRNDPPPTKRNDPPPPTKRNDAPKSDSPKSNGPTKSK